ncbi:ABC transporter A, ABCA [Kipferlia bialata]|uniref:ABC transporter A, ABCA n=1 Tax=Kipferlia bialata TaxID=797122 RepID=A0A9K3GJL9_9EUKA|nr:ABC transporter A, ABCA [Kipferlia bialata]|eukprot:g6160.t1
MLSRNRGILICQFFFPVALFLFSSFLIFITEIILVQCGVDETAFSVEVHHHISSSPNWFTSAVQVFDDPTGKDQEQWGYYMGNGTNYTREPSTCYSGMWRNTLNQNIDNNMPGKKSDCLRDSYGLCEVFPNVSPDPIESEYALDDLLYSQIESVTKMFSLEELIFESSYVPYVDNMGLIVHEGSDVFHYDMDTRTYDHIPDTITTNYTLQLPENVPLVCAEASRIDLQGESMLTIFHNVINDIKVSEHPREYPRRHCDTDTHCHIGVASYPAVLDLSSIVADVTFPLLAFTFAFVFVIHICGLIQEKENLLKHNMLLAGMKLTAYYASWIVACVCLSLIVFAFVYVFGLLSNQTCYTDNSAFAWILLCVCWSIAVTGVSLAYSAFFHKTKLAMFLAVVLLLFMAPVYQYFSILFNLPRAIYLWPFFLFFDILGYLTPMGSMSQTISTRDMFGPSVRGAAFEQKCLLLLTEGVVYALLGAYLDNVLPSAGDSRRHPLFFLACLVPSRYSGGSQNEGGEGSPAVSNGVTEEFQYLPTETTKSKTPRRVRRQQRKAAKKAKKKGMLASVSGFEYDTGGAKEGEREHQDVEAPAEAEAVPPLVCPDRYEATEDPNVTAERRSVSALIESGVTLPPLVIADLRKVFPKRGREAKENVAVHRTTLAVNRGRCFGLLGENGAGKSTTINLICGSLKPTSGTIFIQGDDVRTVSKSRLLSTLGVCPQHDRLHGELTVIEEIVFYMRLRGYSASEARPKAQSIIDSIGLSTKRDHRISSLSGGMQRRTSLGIALTGSPSVILLDEPTSGLDPLTRRELWSIIPRIKGGRSLVLTTHSMDEAEILCDRLAIVASGRLQCLGSPSSLANQFGKTYVLNFLHHNTTMGNRDTATRLQRFLSRSLSPDTRIKNTYGGSTCIVVPRRELSARLVVEVIEASASRLGIEEWSLSDYSLQDVFVDVILRAREKYSLETVMAERAEERRREQKRLRALRHRMSPRRLREKGYIAIQTQGSDEAE